MCPRLNLSIDGRSEPNEYHPRTQTTPGGTHQHFPHLPYVYTGPAATAAAAAAAMVAAGTCTSRWYCPPETLVPTHRVWREHKYDFIQVGKGDLFGMGGVPHFFLKGGLAPCCDIRGVRPYMTWIESIDRSNHPSIERPEPPNRPISSSSSYHPHNPNPNHPEIPTVLAALPLPRALLRAL